MTPILSVIIPTFKRPIFLQRAIASALTAAPDGEVEVVIVPNGPDDSWKLVAQALQYDARVKWYYLPVGHACIARNYGMTQAKGKYVRFLDDDDYLYPAAAEQIKLIELHDADICSAPLENILPNGKKLSVFNLPNSNDFPITALLSIGISGLTQGSIFRTTRIENLKWRDDVVLYDDYLWMLGLAQESELEWIKTSSSVGAYVQHDNARLSRTKRSGRNSQPLVAAILQLHQRLTAAGRATPERTHAAATALLTHAHSAFPSNPFFLSQAIKQAQGIDSTAFPLQAIFRAHPWLGQHLLTTEWMMMGPRYFTRSYRRASWFVNGMLAQRRP